MQTFHYLTHYAFAREALVAAVAVGVVCSLLSVVVVLKRMAFIGQGISHAGFGGIGVAAFLGLHATTAGAGMLLAADGVVMLFCLLTAIAIGALSRRRRVETDTAIGILLVAAMALGVFLDNARRMMLSVSWYAEAVGPQPPMAYEQLLFGSINNIGPTGMWTAVALAVGVLVVAAAMFKELVFYTFDEQVSRVFGVRTRLVYYALLTMLTVTVVITMKLAGVVLVSALLVVPGATALLLSRRLGAVLVLSVVVGLVGSVGGLVLSFELDDYLVPTGPCMVAVLVVQFAAAYTYKSFYTKD